MERPMSPAGLALSATALALAAAIVLTGAPPSCGEARVEIQSGPITLALGGMERPVRLQADGACAPACPVFKTRLRRGSAAAEGAPGEAGRVQRLAPLALERNRLAAQRADEMLGQQRSMGEAARAQTTKDQHRPR